MPVLESQLLARLSNDLGHPGVAPLWLAVQKKGLKLTRKQVENYVKQKGSKQIFQAVQPAKGKTVSEALDARWMMDLIVFENQPVVVAGRTFKYILVAVNVFDRYLYASPLETKMQGEVREALAKLLELALRKPKLISCDQGQEFRGLVGLMLEKKGIVQKFKDTSDVNGIGVIDKAIQTLKQRLAQLATGGGTWASVLAKAVAGINKTPKPGVLHGAAPMEVRDNDDLRFMLLQDQAKNMKHNTALTTRRETAVENTGTFRAPLAESTGKFKRSYQATYGEPQQVASVSGGTVTDTKGGKHLLKTIKVIPANSSDAEQQFAPGQDKPAKKRLAGGAIIVALVKVLEEAEGGQMSISRAAALLKDAMRQDGGNYAETLKKTSGRLIDLIRLSPDRFTLVERPHGTQTWYYVSLV
jgi:hypothetical protein